MSKKKKKKYYQQAVSNFSSTANDLTSAVAGGVSSVTSAVSTIKPVVTDKQAAVYNAHNAEYAMVRHDLVRVLVVNGLFLAGVIALYYVNKSNPFLEAWYQKLF